jgi:malic enzyme
VRVAPPNNPGGVTAAKGIASVVGDDELDEDHIIPSVFNRDVSQAVARAVQEVAERTRPTTFDPEPPAAERAAAP